MLLFSYLFYGTFCYIASLIFCELLLHIWCVMVIRLPLKGDVFLLKLILIARLVHIACLEEFTD